MFNKITTSGYILIASNLFPILMIILNKWSLNEILVLYWCESAIIGFFNIFKILLASKTVDENSKNNPINNLFFVGKIFISIFFTIHFGIFMFVHGVFLFGLVLGGLKSNNSTIYQNFDVYIYNLRWAILALFISHGFSFFKNYIVEGERYNTNVTQAMNMPYSRIVVMHLTLLIGAFLFIGFKTNQSFLIVFVIAKIIIDLSTHIKERKKYNPILQ